MINPRLAFRVLWKTPFVTLVAVASLALGIGANAAIFSVFDQFLLRPLPVPQPDRLVNFSAPGPKPGFGNCGQAGDCTETFTYLMFRDLEHQQTAFTGIAAHMPFDANLAARNHTQSGEGVLVSGSYFGVLGLRPALGRLLDPNDDRQPGESRVVVLSYEYWQSAFGRDPSILNQTLIVNGQSMTVVGVGPRGFTGTTLGARPQAFVPITMVDSMTAGQNGLDQSPRLLGVSLRAAQAGSIDRASRVQYQRAVSRDPQQRRSLAAAGHEREDDDGIPQQAD